jgi:DNA replication protein DnaC
LQDEQRQVSIMLTYTWLGRAWSEPGLAAKIFATFRQERQPEAYDLAQAFAAHPEGTLAFYGSFGTGKTHLLAAITNAVTAAGHRCRFASVVSLFDALQERIQLGQDYHELLRQAIGAPLLVLDDLDKLKPSEFREETLYKLLNGRSTAGLPLALSANNTPDELMRWIGEAGRSRLMAGLIPVPMFGPDYRLEVNT